MFSLPVRRAHTCPTCIYLWLKHVLRHNCDCCCHLQSPERLQARLEELAGGIDKERGLVADTERRARDLQARMDTIAKVCLSHVAMLFNF